MNRDVIPFDGTDDPLYRDVALEHRIELPVLGIDVRFASNSADVIDVVRAAFGAWQTLGSMSAPDATDTALVTVVVHPGDEGSSRAELRHRILGGHRVLLASRGSMGVVDPERREAIAWVTPAFVADTQHFRYALVEAMTMALLTPLDRQPLHAACIVRDDAALVLTGPSGVGKSSLAWAALRSLPGVRVLAEDTVFLQARPSLRIWGLPGYIHLPPDSARRYPELAAVVPTVLNNGKTKLAIDLRSADGAPVLPFVERATVCLLERNGGVPGVRPIGAAQLIDRLLGRQEDGFDLFADTIREPLELLVGQGGWVAELPAEPGTAMEWLEDMLDVVLTRD